jgi:hypothetical protein
VLVWQWVAGDSDMWAGVDPVAVLERAQQELCDIVAAKFDEAARCDNQADVDRLGAIVLFCLFV